MEQKSIMALVGMGIVLKKHQEKYIMMLLKDMEEGEKEKDTYNQKIMYLAVLLAQQDKLSDAVVMDMMKMEECYNE